MPMENRPDVRRTSTSWSSAPASPASTCCTACAAWASRRACSRPADDVGGTWYWNRYPGARCDIPSIDYSYSFDPRARAASGSGPRSTPRSPRSSRYADHVADKYDLRRDIRFSTRVSSGRRGTRPRRAGTCAPSDGDEITCRFYVMATGCLSLPKTPDIAGRRPLRRRGLLHQPLAARGRRLHRQAGRRHRHRLVRHPVDPAHRAGRPRS